MLTPFRHLASVLLLSSQLAACSAPGDVRKPIPTQLIPAPQQPAQRVVVMLPGRGDDLDTWQQQGVARIIQQEWPDADVLLTGLTLPYYRAGVATRRLHDQVVAPLKEDGSRQVWLAGISLGGMGALLYDKAYPDEVHGMLLLSPYLGERAIHQEIRGAGGLTAWSPGPPQPMGSATFQHELWRYLQQWSVKPARTRTVWLAYGQNERFRSSIELLTPELPDSHIVILPGHHDWALWKPALRRLLQASDGH